MKNFILIILAFAGFSQIGFSQHRHTSACMASPETIIVPQEGSVLSIIGRGNNIVSYTETIDGYILIQNEKGDYEYANIVNDVLLNTKVAAHDPFQRTLKEVELLRKIEKHQRFSADKVKQLAQAFYNPVALGKVSEGNNDGVNTDNYAFPTTGKRKILALLIDYPDMPAKYSKDSFYSMLNDSNYKGTGSMRDYYLRNSFGKLDLQIDVQGWYTAKDNYKTYGRNAGDSRAGVLIAQAIDSAQRDGVDFSQYDNDKDGSLDGLIIIHAGPGAEEGAKLDFIWSHRSNLFGSSGRYYDKTSIRNYMINPETRGGINGRMVGIGVYCHEFGHILGLPDLYDNYTANGNSAGLGDWCLMAGGNWNGKEAIQLIILLILRYF